MDDCCRAAVVAAAEELERLNTFEGIAELQALAVRLYTPGNVLSALILRDLAERGEDAS